MSELTAEEVLRRLTSLRQAQHRGQRAPHKPLLVLLALGQLAATGSSRLRWLECQPALSDLLSEFGVPSKTGPRTAAAYPFTHLRADNVWVLDHDVPMDLVGPLDEADASGVLEPAIEAALVADPNLLQRAALRVAHGQFPETVVPDVMVAVGLEPSSGDVAPEVPEVRKRSVAWRREVLRAWDLCCAFCGYSGAMGGAPVGLEAAHVRWFNFDGPDDLDNGLALCSLHHKLLDRGALGLDETGLVLVSAAFTATSEQGRHVYRLHGVRLRPRPGTPLPAGRHIRWHQKQVFRGEALPA